MVAEPGDPVMIVVGGGAIALSTAQELCALQGHRVVVLWRRDPDLARAVESIRDQLVGQCAVPEVDELLYKGALEVCYPKRLEDRIERRDRSGRRSFQSKGG